ncbi:hypothetical protein [Shimia thalassica]|uniref:hypothetical protein n=1 Tax=Shimia thalassica TaxID=1715693 RepID=UPI002494234F|nr:hypothetical protein [Shimia thalassica]
MEKPRILFSSARFGAKYFLDIYSQLHPNDLVLGEIFRRQGDNIKVLSDLLKVEPADIKRMAAEQPVELWKRLKDTEKSPNLIALVYYYHQPRESELWAELAETAEIYHLYRSNLFSAYLSRKIAMDLGRWQRHKNEARIEIPERSLDVSTKEAEKYIRERESEIQWCREYFKDADYHEFCFEDITLSDGTCARRLKEEDPIGVNGSVSQAISSKYAPIKQISNADLVNNYSEVAHLDGVRYQIPGMKDMPILQH